MKKALSLLIIVGVIFLTGCTGRRTLEENDANAPVTVEDARETQILTAAQTSSAENTSVLLKM